MQPNPIKIEFTKQKEIKKYSVITDKILVIKHRTIVFYTDKLSWGSMPFHRDEEKFILYKETMF